MTCHHAVRWIRGSWFAAMVAAMVAAAVLGVIASPRFARADDPAETPTCSSDPHFALLDFWLGDWDVFVNGKKAGENHIEKILAGCAITEDWTAADGTRGHSLFYYLPAAETWKQVWVTENALGRGGLKEKEMIARLPYGGARFLGTIYLPDGRSYLDRTTLTPQGPDEVRQLIEISNDGGKEWLPVFDGQYLRKK